MDNVEFDSSEYKTTPLDTKYSKPRSSDMVAYKQGLDRLMRENGRVDVPSYLHEFFQSHRDMQFDEMYSELLSVVPSNAKVPTYNEALTYYNLDKLQVTADRIYKAIEMIHQEESISSEEEHRLNSLERKYQEVSSLILRYATAGVDRETPKQMNINVNHLDLNSIHQQIREIRDGNNDISTSQTGQTRMRDITPKDKDED